MFNEDLQAVLTVIDRQGYIDLDTTTTNDDDPIKQEVHGKHYPKSKHKSKYGNGVVFNQLELAIKAYVCHDNIQPLTQYLSTFQGPIPRKVTAIVRELLA